MYTVLIAATVKCWYIHDLQLELWRHVRPQACGFCIRNDSTRSLPGDVDKIAFLPQFFETGTPKKVGTRKGTSQSAEGKRQLRRKRCLHCPITNGLNYSQDSEKGMIKMFNALITKSSNNIEVFSTFVPVTHARLRIYQNIKRQSSFRAFAIARARDTL